MLCYTKIIKQGGKKMKDRIRELRKSIGLTLEEFGTKIGIKKNSLSQIENGKNNITEQLIISICNVDWNGKKVNETWLRNGTGMMFIEQTRGEQLSAFFENIKVDDNRFKKKFVSILAEMTEDEWKMIEKIVVRLSNEVYLDTTEEAMTLEETSDIYKISSSNEKIEHRNEEKSEVLQKNSSIPATVEKEKTVKELEEEYKKIHLKTASKKESTVLNITDGKESKDKNFI